MRWLKISIYMILGAVPATFWCMNTLPPVLRFDIESLLGYLPLLGTIGLWLSIFDFLHSNYMVRLVTVLLLSAGIVAMSPVSIAIVQDLITSGVEGEIASGSTNILGDSVFFLSLTAPVMIAAHYIMSSLRTLASNKRLQINAATPRD